MATKDNKITPSPLKHGSVHIVVGVADYSLATSIYTVNRILRSAPRLLHEDLKLGKETRVMRIVMQPMNMIPSLLMSAIVVEMKKLHLTCESASVLWNLHRLYYVLEIPRSTRQPLHRSGFL
jgi:hypothetical protein